MLEIANVTDYGKYSYNRDADGRKESSDVGFGDIMAGSEEMSERHESARTYFERNKPVSLSPSVEVITYTDGGKIFMYRIDIGSNLDLTV